MRFKHRFIANQGNIKKLENAQRMALKMTAEALLTELISMQVVPKDTGTLEQSGFVNEQMLDKFVVSIVFDTPYARRLYWHPEYNFRQDKNVNAQGRWMDDFLYGDKKNWIKETYIKFFKQLAGGLIK